MNIAMAAGVEMLTIMKAAQIGASEALRIVMACIAYMLGLPISLTLPNRIKGRKIIDNRVRTIFERMDVLKLLHTPRKSDLQKEQIKLLNGFILHLMWAGSAVSMKSDPIYMQINDEVDDFPMETDRQASAIDMGFKRLATYEDGRQINLGTPTTRFGNVAQLFDDSPIKLYYYVPCPHCGAFQRLHFAQLKYKAPKKGTKSERAGAVMRNRSAWYVCSECERAIRHGQKAAMVRDGRWSSEAGHVVGADGKRYADAEQVPVWPAGTRIGMQISRLYCLWAGGNWWNIAAEQIRSTGSRSKMFDFTTQTLGRPFEQQVQRPAASVFGGKVERAKIDEGVAPGWTQVIVATVDMQKDHFYVVMRAWGGTSIAERAELPGVTMKSQRVWHGRVETWDQLDEICLARRWEVDDPDAAAMAAALTLVDSGGTREEGAVESRTMEAYRWGVARRAAGVRLIKGASKRKGTYRFWFSEGYLPSTAEERKRGRKVPLIFHWKETFEDELQDLVDCGVAGENKDKPEVWLLNKRGDEEYDRQMSNVHKVVVRERGGYAEKWIPVQSGVRHDYHDCETYQVLAAWVMRLDMLPTVEEMHKQRAAAAAAAKETEKRKRQTPRSTAWTPKRLDPDKYM